jgi:predicted GH43/DUF377 family glycosyl hydrolase
MERQTGSAGRLQRLGVVMEPRRHDLREAGGVLNPAVARGPDGQLYLLPRLVAAGNYSRIGLCRVVIDRRGNPVVVERLGVVLEPEASYERNPHNGGGVEDPRITALGAGRLYVMAYTALGPTGPRIAAAVSRDLVHWQRRGLVHFAPCHGGPDVPAELAGVVPGVVFPTGVDVRRDGRLDVYDGMADSRIGVAYAGLADLLLPAQPQAA